MPLIDLSPGDRVPGSPQAVVAIPLYGAHGYFKSCLVSLLRHTHAAVPILVADDADPDPAAREWVAELDAAGTLRHAVHWLRQPRNLGFPGNVNAAFAASGDADVAVVNSDCEVAGGWLEGLRAAAYCDSNVASATAFTNHGTIVSVPHRNQPQPALPQHLPFELLAARVREGALGLRPRIPTIVGHCFLVRRDALELVGDFDETFAPGYGEEVDFSQRCLAVGLQHVAADDVLVLHRGGASLSGTGARSALQERNDKIVAARYPWYEASVDAAASDRASALARSVASARRALLGCNVTIDGRVLTPSLTGTQVNALEFIHALWRSRRVGLRVVVPPDLGGYAREAFAEMPGIRLVTLEQALAEPRDDVVHRPYQISGEADLSTLERLGESIVLTQLDLIAYRNPTYFPSAQAWLDYRKLTQAGLNLADLVCFCTRQGADDALADGLVDEGRVRVVPLGADHRLTLAQPEPRVPELAAQVAGEPFLLCLGTDFRHKNRVFAMRVLDALRERHGWPGHLVLAGPRVAGGSSGPEEADWLARHPATGERVVMLPAVDEAEKAWLVDHATAMLYPTTYEGFGFIPFESGAAGLPCFFAGGTSMGETLAGVTSVIVPWDPDATADAAIEYLVDERARRRLVAELQSAAANHIWERTAQLTLEAYDGLGRLAPPPARAAAQLTLEFEARARAAHERRLEYEGRYWALRQEIGPTGFTLVGPDGSLPEDAQRTLSALTKRRATRAPLVGGLRLARRLTRPGKGSV